MLFFFLWAAVAVPLSSQKPEKHLMLLQFRVLGRLCSIVLQALSVDGVIARLDS